MARIGRSWVWADARSVAKYLPVDETEMCSSEWAAAKINAASPAKFAPELLSATFEDALPTGERERCLALRFERFPFTLRRWVAERGRLDRAATLELFRVVALVHASGIAHRDLHADNVVVRETADGPEFRLIDFASAFFSVDGELAVEFAGDVDAFRSNALRRMVTLGDRKK